MRLRMPDSVVATVVEAAAACSAGVVVIVLVARSFVPGRPLVGPCWYTT